MKVKLALRPHICLAAAICLAGVPARGAGRAHADSAAHPLPFAQDWSTTSFITTSNDWSSVPGILGYRGDALTSSDGADPQLILAPGDTTPLNVAANQTNPNTFTTGGVAEFDTLADPSIALQGSGTADAPHIVINLDTRGWQSVTVEYLLRDLDGSADNAAQQVALHYRVGAGGGFVNVPAAYVADATHGPSLATLTTTVSVTLSASVNNKPLVQLRILTSNAAGSDEWVGIDDIRVTGAPLPPGSADISVAKSGPASAVPGSLVTYTLSVLNYGPAAASVVLTDSLPTGFVAVTHTASVSASTGSGSLAWDIGSLASGAELSFTLVLSAAGAPGIYTNTITASTAVTESDSSNNAATATTVLGLPPVPARIRDIQGASHTSPLNGSAVASVPGIVTLRRPSSFYMQDATSDGDPSTSEGILVFTGSTPTVNVGDAVLVTATVQEFRPGGSGGLGNLTLTELVNPSVMTLSSGNILPAPVIMGIGGRLAPTQTIENDASGDVELGALFDPANDGLDFYESLEGMRVQVNDALAVGPTSDFGEIAVVADNGAHAGERQVRGGVVISPTDFNPERIIIDDAAIGAAMPRMNVGDSATAPITGVIDYAFENFKLLVAAPFSVTLGALTPETTTAVLSGTLAVATMNVENLSVLDPITKFNRLAGIVVNNLGAPDLLALEEVQDNSGPGSDGVVDATQTYSQFIAAIAASGGPSYQFTQIDPVNGQDGGQPGGNIRVGFLFRTDRGLSLTARPGAVASTPNTVITGTGGVRLQYSPGRIDPANTAFSASRKPLAAEFAYRGKALFVIANHFNSKGGDDALFGRYQPPVLNSENQRVAQAVVVRDFVAQILSADPAAAVIVLGDLNDFEWSPPLSMLKAAGFTTLVETLPKSERYTYVFEGNSQVLDHIMVSPHLRAAYAATLDIVHVNSEFFDQVSDHDPQVATFEPVADGSRLYLPLVAHAP